MGDRNCPAAVNENDRRQQHWECSREATVSRPGGPWTDEPTLLVSPKTCRYRPWADSAGVRPWPRGRAGDEARAPAGACDASSTPSSVPVTSAAHERGFHDCTVHPHHRPGPQARRLARAVRRLRDRPVHLRRRPAWTSEVARTTQICSELEIMLFDSITSEQLDEAVIQVALQNVKEDPAFDTIAARLLVKTLYKKVFGQTRDLFSEGRADHHRRPAPGPLPRLHRARRTDRAARPPAARAVRSGAARRRPRTGPRRPAALHRRADDADPLHDQRPARRPERHPPTVGGAAVLLDAGRDGARAATRPIRPRRPWASTPRCRSWTTWPPAPPWSTPAPRTPSSPTAS